MIEVNVSSGRCLAELKFRRASYTYSCADPAEAVAFLAAKAREVAPENPNIAVLLPLAEFERLAGGAA